MNWEQILKTTVGGIGVFAVFWTSHTAVEAGTATEAQKKLVSSFDEVLSEYETKNLLQQMQAEAAAIEEREQQFEKKWGKLLPGKKE